MTGFAAIFLALVVTGFAAFSYFNAHFAAVTRPGQTGRKSHGALFCHMAAGLIILGAAHLYYILLTDQFQYAYVFGYSAKELPLAYKISAFWAGQEGSFLLWLVFHSVIGVILTRSQSASPGVMAIYSLLQAILLTILLAKSPFMVLPEQRADGAGLNPLLQDPWMVIHPPVVFLGYAGLAVPFAYALGGLLMSDNRHWIKPALAWALLSWSALGAGIFIGGYWAYKVLGWGGYWAWDPVENSSLIPWLACGVLIHLLIVSLRRPATVKPAYLAAIFTFVLVLYGTFLTRSGILSNFSTHSFTDEGIGGLLAGLVMITLAASLLMLTVRWPSLPAGELYQNIKSREFMTLAGALALAVLAVMVLVGTSTPLVTMLAGNPQNVSTSFYNAIALPMAVFILAFLVLGSLVGWGEEGRTLSKRYIWLPAVGLTAAAVGFMLGVRGILPALVLGMAAAALVAAGLAARKGFTRPAVVTHAGVAVMIIGIIASSAANQSVIASFQPGESKEILGRNITFAGVEPAADRKGIHQNFVITGSDSFTVQTLTKLSRDGRPAVREPAIHRGLLADTYIAPSLNQEPLAGKEVILARGEQKSEAGLAVKLIRYGMAGGDPQNMRVYALLQAALNGKTEEIRPELAYHNGHFEAVPAKAFGDFQITLTTVIPSEGKVKVEIANLTQPSAGTLDVEISRKPLINLVWLGTALVTAGTLWAGWRRLTAAVIQERTAAKLSAAK